MSDFVDSLIGGSEPLYTPIKTLVPQNNGELPYHGHTPKDGSEIIWNNIQQAKLFNAQIEILKRTHETPENLHYLKVPLLPTVGYNQHYHTSEFDGGYVYGGGLHSHLGNFDGGYCFATYAPSEDAALYVLPYSQTTP